MTAVGFALLFPSLAASAQTATKGNISFGYSYVRGNLSSNRPLSPTISSSNLNGWFTSAEYKPIPWLGGVLDAHTSASGPGFSNADTSVATALGGGVAFRLAKTIAWRMQGDYLPTHFFGSSQNHFRFSAGLVVRF